MTIDPEVSAILTQIKDRADARIREMKESSDPWMTVEPQDPNDPEQVEAAAHINAEINGPNRGKYIDEHVARLREETNDAIDREFYGRRTE